MVPNVGGGVDEGLMSVAAATDAGGGGGEVGVVVDGAELVHGAGGHDADVGAVFGHVGEEVGGDDEGFALVAEVAEEFAELGAAGGVESGGGFVEEDDGGVGQQRARDAKTLPHAAGEAFDALVGFFGEPDFLEPEVDAASLACDGGEAVAAAGDEGEEIQRGVRES